MSYLIPKEKRQSIREQVIKDINTFELAGGALSVDQYGEAMVVGTNYTYVDDEVIERLVKYNGMVSAYLQEREEMLNNPSP